MPGPNLGFKHQTHRPFGIEDHGHSLGRSLGAEDLDNGVVEDLDPSDVNSFPFSHRQSKNPSRVTDPTAALRNCTCGSQRHKRGKALLCSRLSKKGERVAGA